MTVLTNRDITIDEDQGRGKIKDPNPDRGCSYEGAQMSEAGTS